MAKLTYAEKRKKETPGHYYIEPQKTHYIEGFAVLTAAFIKFIIDELAALFGSLA